jgi:hypothetical protein
VLEDALCNTTDLSQAQLSLKRIHQALKAQIKSMEPNAGGNPTPEKLEAFARFINDLAIIYTDLTKLPVTFYRDRIDNAPKGKFYTFAREIMLIVEPKLGRLNQYLEKVVLKIATTK